MPGATTSSRSRLSTALRATPWLALCLWALTSSAFASSPPRYSARYDDAIRSAAKKWLPLYPSWKRGKAQLIQESQLDPMACSAVGACGLGQFMPGTWADVVRSMGWQAQASRHDAGMGIEAWAYYQGRLVQAWKANRPAEDRIALAEASYNAGMGNILKAQTRCNGANLYDEIMACLPAITGDHSRETIGYTRSIRKIWKQLEMQ